MICDESTTIAIKVIHINKSEELIKVLKNEIKILNLLDSPYVVKYLDFHATKDKV